MDDEPVGEAQDTAAAGEMAPSPPPPPPLGQFLAPPPAAAASLSMATPWVVPAAADPVAPAGRIRLVVIPTAVLLIGMLASLVTAGAGDRAGSGAYRSGYLLGSVLVGLILAAITYAVLRRRMHPGRAATYRLIAAAVPLVVAFGRLATMGAAASVPDPSTAMAIGAPYTLTAAGSDVTASLEAAAHGQPYALRLVKSADGTTVAVLMATRGTRQPDAGFWSDFDRGVVGNAGATSTTTQYRGHEARLLKVGAMAGLTWVTTSGIAITVYASDPTTAQAVADKVPDAGP